MKNLIREHPWAFSIGCVLALLAVFAYLNKMVDSSIKEIDQDMAVERKITPAEIPQKKAEHKDYSKSEITCKIRLDATRKYYRYDFYAGDERIAQLKARLDDVVSLNGEIPDGRIKFINETDDTFGEISFLNNLLHGDYIEYYQNRQVKMEAKYYKGKLRTSKEYFDDGVLRMEKNMEDALRFVEGKELGEGKVYHRDGTLRYHWNMTNEKNGGFKKSYNIRGELIDEKYYNEKGELTEHINHIEPPNRSQ